MNKVVKKVNNLQTSVSFVSSGSQLRLKNCTTTVDMLDPQTGSLKIEWLNTVQAAGYLSVSIGTLRNMTSNGQIPYSKLGWRNRYSLEKLNALLLQNQRGKNGN
jgi:excisionase family DNA binding protein